MTTSSLTSTQQDLLRRISGFDKTPREVLVEAVPTTVIRFRDGRWEIVDQALLPGLSVPVSPSIIPVRATPEELEAVLPFLDAPGGVGALREALNEAETLIEGALRLVQNNDPESALWRLVDAAGIVARVTEDDASGQEGRPTGRGFFIGGVPRLSSTHRRR